MSEKKSKFPLESEALPCHTRPPADNTRSSSLLLITASAPVALLFWEQAKMLIPATLHFCPEHSLVRDQMGSSSSCCSNERLYAARNITPSATVTLSSSRLLSAGGAARTSDHLLCCLFTCLLSSLDWTLYKNTAGFCLLPSPASETVPGTCTVSVSKETMILALLRARRKPQLIPHKLQVLV